MTLAPRSIGSLVWENASRAGRPGPRIMNRTSMQKLRLPLMAGACVVLIALWTAIAYQLHQLRAEAIDSARRHGDNITTVIGEHFLLFAGSIDSTLKHLRVQWLRDPTRFSTTVKEQLALPDNMLIQIAGADARGRILFPAGQHASVGDRGYFAEAREGAGDVLHIGTPVNGRVSGKIGIPFAVAIRDTGGFRGVMVASIAAEGLVRAYRAIDLGEDGFI